MIKKWGVMGKQSILIKVKKIQYSFCDNFDKLSQRDKYTFLHLDNIGKHH
ncbi:MAG: hypothetical protein AAB532_03810 [Patescibacteria group bacterium]